jgi:hypothetical protein
MTTPKTKTVPPKVDKAGKTYRHQPDGGVILRLPTADADTLSGLQVANASVDGKTLQAFIPASHAHGADLPLILQARGFHRVRA